jgi:hypothetical protein
MRRSVANRTSSAASMETGRTRAAGEIMNLVRMGAVETFSAPVLRLMLTCSSSNRENYDDEDRFDAVAVHVGTAGR